MATITGNFAVNGVPFAKWYNTTIVPTNPKLYPRIVEDNFNTVFGKHLENLTGFKEISVEEFSGHCAIMLNETGGTFKPIRELGGQAYAFNKIMPNGQAKRSYNQAPNRLAGNQLKEWGVISSDQDVAIWNGQAYPVNAPEVVRNAAAKCDFYRFRGYGFNQLTWKDNFIACLQPHLPKPIDEYGIDEFELAIKDFRIAALTFKNFITKFPASKTALEAMKKADFAPYGKLVSGGWMWYVTNHYLPRVNAIYNGIKNAQIAPIIL